MEALQHLSRDLRHLSDDRILTHPPRQAGPSDCLELQVGPVNFLLVQTPEWREGIVLVADLGQIRGDPLGLMRDALSLNMGHAAAGEAIYGIDPRDSGDVLTCVQRIASSHCHAGGLASQLEAIATQCRTWTEAGFLRPAST